MAVYCQDPISPSPRDFAKFVYCGVAWAFSKNTQWHRYVPFTRRIGISDRERNLQIGQANEHRCVELITRLLDIDSGHILYDGTRPTAVALPTSLSSLGRPVMCRPDLIVRCGSSLKLFEFKAVSEYTYLDLDEFRSDIAQLQCYTHIVGEVAPSSYYLLRYYVDPLNEGCHRMKEMTKGSFLDNFVTLWDLYSRAIRYIETTENVDPSRPELKSLFNVPDRSEDIRMKCSSCAYNYVCQIRGWKAKGYRIGKSGDDWY